MNHDNDGWTPPQRPADYAEEALITALLDGTYPAGVTLPGERDLAAQLGVTRPTLREVLRRLERDGWLTVRHGKATIVNDFWHEGGLNVLSGLVRYGKELPPNFISQLLQVRLDLAPSYTRAAAIQAPESVIALLTRHTDLADTAEAFAAYDWTVHHHLTAASGNPIYTLILNGFAGFYEQMARLYFARPEARDRSRRFYADLLTAVRQGDDEAVAQLTRRVMADSITAWQAVEQAAEKEN